MKRKTLFKIAAVLLIAALAFWGWQKKKRTSVKESFQTVAVERGNLRISVQATGSTMPQNRLELKPPIAGRIESISVKEGQKVKKGEILAWLSSTERAALLDAARAKGEGELKYWEQTYKPTPLVSPMDGVVIARNMEPGQTVTVQDAPLVMSDRLIVKGQVDETDIGQLGLEQAAEIVLDAYPEKKIPGKVSHIAYEAKTVNNVTVYEVDVLPAVVPPFMRAGMTANLTFIVKEKRDALLIPAAAVRRMDGQERVLIMGPASQGGRRGRLSKEIQTGMTDGKNVEVVQGLSEGESVLVPDLRLDSSEGKRGGGNPFSPFGGSRPGGANRGGGGRRSQ